MRYYAGCKKGRVIGGWRSSTVVTSRVLRNLINMFSISRLPYANFHVALFPPEASTKQRAQYLFQTYLQLLDSAITHVRSLPPSVSTTSTTFSTTTVSRNPARISYNLLLTHSTMSLIPRRKESFEWEGMKFSMNSLPFFGMVLSKTDQELQFLKDGNVKRILSEVAYPNASDEELPIEVKDV
ncbi:hypothetical protein BT69DRAFT_248912 [Atractiella rhizophila]|nr:hypothetical protein BT69DRAFT_248912 [Atractiella rhizophila]